MLVFVFKDSKNNSIEITAPTKTAATNMLKRVNMGDTTFRYDSHRDETKEEWCARMDRAARKKQQRAEAAMRRAVARAGSQPEAPVSSIRRRGKKIGPNHRCPCGSGKKYKRCCGRRREMVGDMMR